MTVQEQASAAEVWSAVSSRAPVTNRNGQVLIVGGYGEVGQVVSRALSRFLPGRVVVAGRSAHRARNSRMNSGMVRRAWHSTSSPTAGRSTCRTSAWSSCASTRSTRAS